MRRQFTLPAEDMEWLEGTAKSFELIAEGGSLRVVIHDWPVPPGYNVASVVANVRIDPGYPDTQIDMVYFHPALALTNGKTIKAISAHGLDSKQYQQWSRHRTAANPWRPGLDNVCTHLMQVDTWLQRELK